MSQARDIAANFIAEREAFRANPYQDQGGVWTFGFGSTRDRNGDPVTADTPPIDKDEALALLERDLDTAVAAVDGAVTVLLTDDQRAALYDFTYNVGAHAFETSTLLKDLNNDDTIGVLHEFPRWNKAGGAVSKGLINRRTAEMELFEAG